MRRTVFALVLAMSISGSMSGTARAVTPEEQLADPKLEARAVEISRKLRCVVCQNQTIDDSDAALAADLRILLRERLAAGATDQQAMDYLVARYGEYVLMSPPFKLSTWALWLGPFAALIACIGGLAYMFRRRADQAPVSDFTEDEERQLSEILKRDNRA
jgi:cytochrome c-type biogenesis protein CcmH